MTTPIFYKAVNKDGKSHYDDKTLWVPGKRITVTDAPADKEPCGRGIHGSPTLLGAVGYQTAPSRYLTFTPVGECLGSDDTKSRFRSVLPGEYLSAEETNTLAGFNLHEANNAVNPLHIERDMSLDLPLLVAQWASVRDSVGDSVGNSVRASVWASVRASVWDSVRDSVWASVGNSVRASVGASVWDSVWAYTGGLFPGITSWKYAESLGADPWRPLLTLWYGGYVPSFDGTTYRLHSGANAAVVWQCAKADLPVLPLAEGGAK